MDVLSLGLKINQISLKFSFQSLEFVSKVG